MNGLGCTIKMNLVTFSWEVWIYVCGHLVQGCIMNHHKLMKNCSHYFPSGFHGARERPAQPVWAWHLWQSCSRTLVGCSVWGRDINWSHLTGLYLGLLRGMFRDLLETQLGWLGTHQDLKGLLWFIWAEMRQGGRGWWLQHRKVWVEDSEACKNMTHLENCEGFSCPDT